MDVLSVDPKKVDSYLQPYSFFSDERNPNSSRRTRFIIKSDAINALETVIPTCCHIAYKTTEGVTTLLNTMSFAPHANRNGNKMRDAHFANDSPGSYGSSSHGVVSGSGVQNNGVVSNPGGSALGAASGSSTRGTEIVSGRDSSTHGVVIGSGMHNNGIVRDPGSSALGVVGGSGPNGSGADGGRGSCARGVIVGPAVAAPWLDASAFRCDIFDIAES